MSGRDHHERQLVGSGHGFKGPSWAEDKDSSQTTVVLVALSTNKLRPKARYVY